MKAFLLLRVPWPLQTQHVKSSVSLKYQISLKHQNSLENIPNLSKYPNICKIPKSLVNLLAPMKLKISSTLITRGKKPGIVPIRLEQTKVQLCWVQCQASGAYDLGLGSGPSPALSATAHTPYVTGSSWLYTTAATVPGAIPSSYWHLQSLSCPDVNGLHFHQ